MTQMIRKYFLLPLPLDERIKLVARTEHKSEAEVIRELIEQGLQTTKTHGEKPQEKDLQALLSLVLRGLRTCHKTSISTSTTKMQENRETIIFDASGLTALMNETDEFHTRALRISEILTDRASWRVLLPHEIFVETVTALSKRVSRKAGAKAAEAILERQRAGDFVFSEADPLIYEKAIDLLRTAKGYRGAPSFFDCLVMAFATHYQTRYIFGFDEAFTKNGYRLPEAPNNQQAA